LLGKLVASSIKSFTLLLAMLPAFALPIWMGGVSGTEFWQTAAALFAALLFSMTAGLFVSCRSSNPFSALLGTFVLLVVLFGVPAAAIPLKADLPHWMLGPFGMLLSAWTPGAPQSDFGAAFLYSAVWSVVFLALAPRFVRNLELDASSPKKWWWRFLHPAHKKVPIPDNPWKSPAEWLGTRLLPQKRILWLAVGVAVFTAFLFGLMDAAEAVFLIQLGFGFVLKLWIAALSVQPLQSARQTGALELMLSTPLNPESISRGHINALQRYFGPPAVVSSFAILLAAALGDFARTGSPNVFGESIVASILSAVWLVSFILDMNALIYMGLWTGFTEPHGPRAIAKTVVRVLVLPWITTLVPCVGLLGFLIWPLSWIVWAGNRLRLQLKAEAVKPISSSDSDGSWWSLFAFWK
jgi:hypothetical protein